MSADEGQRDNGEKRQHGPRLHDSFNDGLILDLSNRIASLTDQRSLEKGLLYSEPRHSDVRFERGDFSELDHNSVRR